MAKDSARLPEATTSQTDERIRRWLVANICPAVHIGGSLRFLRQLLGVRPEDFRPSQSHKPVTETGFWDCVDNLSAIAGN